MSNNVFQSHQTKKSPVRRALPFIAALIVAVILIAALRIFTSGGASDPTDLAGPDASGAPSAPRENCVDVQVVASSEKAALLSELADTYNATDPSVEDECVNVLVSSKASGGAMDALAKGWDEGVDGPRPDVWSPASSSWLRLLSQRTTERDMPDLVPADAPSVASSPLVIAMPRPMAEALGWPDAELGWSDVLSLSQDPEGWGGQGHPEWGDFRLGKTNPNFSTSGLHATVGAYFAATGLSSDLSSANVAAPEVQEYVSQIESSAVHYGDTTLTFLTNMDKASKEGRGLTYVSAVTLEEKSVLDYNQGNPTGDPALVGEGEKPSVPLAAIYPKEGTLVSDSPFAVLAADWVDEQKSAAAADFLTFLQSDESQERFQEAGFRTFEGEAGETISESNGLLADQPATTLSSPSPSVLGEILAAWDDNRKKARVLLVIDVSGSMGQPASGGTRLELAKGAALNSLEQFSPEDEVGLWIFSTARDGDTPYLELVPVAPVGENIEDLRERIANLAPDGGTALYATARAARNKMQTEFDESRINAVVFLTDGRNEFPQDSDLDGLLRTLKSGSETNSVPVFTIGYSEEADLDTLEKIAEATNATDYDASDPANIDKIFTAVISNF